MRYLLSFYLALTVFSSCYQDEEMREVIEIIVEVPQPEDETGLIGTVTDPDGLLIEDYEVEVNNVTYDSPSSIFQLRGVGIHKEGQLVEIYKDDQLVTMANPYLLEDDINKIDLVAFPEFQTEILSSVVILSSDISISIPQDALAGDIPIQKLLIEDSRLLSQMGTSAYTRDGQLTAISPSAAFVTVAIDNGKQLELQDQALTSLSVNGYPGHNLYVYHRKFGYWLDLGAVGEEPLLTDQLGYYMIATTQPGIYAEGIVEYDGQRISYAKGELQYSNIASVVTSENGRWANVFPLGADVEVELQDACNSIVATSSYTIAPTIEEHITEVASGTSIYNLETSVLSCDGNSILFPSVRLATSNSSDVFLFSDAQVDRLVLLCNDESFEIAGYDNDTGESGPSFVWELDNSNIDFLSQCNESNDGFAHITIKDESEFFSAFNLTTTSDQTILESSDSRIRIVFRGSEERSYQNDEVNIYINDPDFGTLGYKVECAESLLGCGFQQFNVTHYEESGGWLRASFSGTLWGQTISNPSIGNLDIEGVIAIKV